MDDRAARSVRATRERRRTAALVERGRWRTLIELVAGSRADPAGRDRSGSSRDLRRTPRAPAHARLGSYWHVRCCIVPLEIRGDAMLNHPTLLERFAFGRPLEIDDDPDVRAAERPTTALIGRIMLGAIFMLSGIGKLVYIDQTVQQITQVGIPGAHTLAIVAGVAEICGALSLIFGFLTRVGAVGLVIYLIPTTLLFHNFWAFAGEMQTNQMVNFMKNLAIIGGLLTVAAHGASRFSLDAKMRRPRPS
jgi:putative oxidoreductase